MLNHFVCDLDRERRIAEARRIRTIRSVGRARQRPGWWRRVVRRRRRIELPPDAADLHGAVDDVWHALRFDGGR